MLRGTFGKYKAFKKRVACQAVSAVNTVASSFTYRIQSVHRGLTVTVNIDTTHKVMLRRNNRNAQQFIKEIEDSLTE